MPYPPVIILPLQPVMRFWMQVEMPLMRDVAPIMIRTANGKVVTIAGLGYWSASIPADIFMHEFNGKMPYGVLRTVVPAAPDAWITALRDFGTMTFGDVASAAIEFARDDFSVFPFLASAFADNAEHLRHKPTNAALFLPDDRRPCLGERFIQNDLASTIQFMVDEEQAAASPSAHLAVMPRCSPCSRFFSTFFILAWMFRKPTTRHE